MISQTIFFESAYTKRQSQKTEVGSLFQESILLTKRITPTPIKEIAESFWKVWTAKV